MNRAKSLHPKGKEKDRPMYCSRVPHQLIALASQPKDAVLPHELGSAEMRLLVPVNEKKRAFQMFDVDQLKAKAEFVNDEIFYKCLFLLVYQVVSKAPKAAKKTQLSKYSEIFWSTKEFPGWLRLKLVVEEFLTPE